MADITTPPHIPTRTRHYGRRQSVPGPSSYMRTNDANRVSVHPASPEVISSLITSLAIISSPANELFEQSDELSSLSASARAAERYMYNLDASRRDKGSFGVDYGAFKQPSLEDDQNLGPLDELAASPPVIRTAKPPSGFSPLTALKTPSKEGSFKTFLRVSSRPSSKGSNGSRDFDDVSSIGSVSIEPGIVSSPELRKKSSSESWGKKQGRNAKGLMYMSSKERLRDSERKRANVVSGGGSKGLGIDYLPSPRIGSDAFLAERPISEEKETIVEQERPSAFLTTDVTTSGSANISLMPSPNIGPVSPALSSGSQGGPGSPRNIPARDSSLGKPQSTSNRSSNPSSRHSENKRENNGDRLTTDIQGKMTQGRDRSTEKRQRDRIKAAPEHTNKLQQPLKSPPSFEPLKASTLASKQVAESAKIEEHLVVMDGEDDGAPSPAIAQRKSRTSYDNLGGFLGRNRSSGTKTPEPLDARSTNGDSYFKRLSTPLSPTNSAMESHHRSSSQPLSRHDLKSPEPARQSKISQDDRPTSADSVDDAVDSYLCSPRLSQKIRHTHTGRVISFSEVGDPEGYAVFCCVGMGLTRYITAFYDELALTLKLRLITPDRPGVGDSEPYTDGTATPLSWPDDVYAICQALKITKFSILAHSAGAIYALATALRMPQHIRGRIHLLAPWIPPSQLNVVGAQQAALPSSSIPTSQRILRALPTPMLKVANSSFMSATSTSITSSLPKSPRRSKRRAANGRETPLPGPNAMIAGMDKENLGPNSAIYPKPTTANSFDRAAKIIDDPNSQAAILAAAANTLAQKERQSTYDTRLTHAIWDLATTGANPAVDLLVCLERRHTIGFRYVDITRALVIHHGTKDSRVPVENVKWLGKMMKRCEVRILEGEGHGLMASAGVMGGVLMEIAKEWEDWMSVVQKKPSADPVKGRTLRERASVGAFR